MKKSAFKLLILCAFALTTILSSCSKDDDKDTPPSFKSVTFTEETVMNRIPEALKNSSDDKAQECVGWIEDAADWTTFMENMTPPAEAVKVSNKSTSSEDTYTWTWAYGGEVITFFWTYEETSTKHIWEMDIQYNNGPRYTYITAWESLDGSEGELQYNFQWACAMSASSENECEDFFWTYRWTTDSQGVLTLLWDYESQGDEVENFLQIEVVSNPDGSGSVKYYTLDTLNYHIIWDALGNGEWHWYFGGSEQSGTWAV